MADGGERENAGKEWKKKAVEGVEEALFCLSAPFFPPFQVVPIHSVAASPLLFFGANAAWLSSSSSSSLASLDGRSDHAVRTGRHKRRAEALASSILLLLFSTFSSSNALTNESGDGKRQPG